MKKRIATWKATYDMPHYGERGVCWICGKKGHGVLKCDGKDAAKARLAAVKKPATVPATQEDLNE